MLPNLPDPLLLADYLKSTFDSASEEQPNLQIASLSGLFVLMARHQLEYANYFQKLYSLINAKVFLCQESKRYDIIIIIIRIYYFLKILIKDF